ncbi:MAG: glycosyltransferase family 2 protein [Terricaulis silvestris]
MRRVHQHRMEQADPQAGDTPLVGVIVVAYNSRRHLARQRAALEAQTEQRWKLIVIDNASAPDERPRQKELPGGARIIQSDENLGFAAANNRAAAQLDTPFLVFLNPDAFPEPTWLAELLAAAQRLPDVDAFGSTQISDLHPSRLDGAGDEMPFFAIPYRAFHGASRALNPEEGECFSACAAAALYRADAFHKLGGFDERLFCYCEDVDLGYRLRLGGGVTMQVTNAAVRHIGGGASPTADRLGARNALWVFVKNTPLPLLIVLSPLHATATIMRASAHALQGRFHTWRGVWEGVRGLGQIWRARRKVHEGRAAGSRDIARALIWSPLRVLARASKR